jgi:tRNA 5-methylaminomethyl-2-thiouridine biosynthesis bifunctional protein
MSKTLPSPAVLQWDEHGQPVSAAYDDVYFSRANGLAETQHVFIHGNNLVPRMATHAEPWFVVGETGFGTGLNVLAAWQCWAALPEPKPNLHIITLDLHPLQMAALEKAHEAWPEVAEYAKQLREAYPPLWPGMHRRYLAEGRICIDFLWGEASEMLAAYQPAYGAVKVDAWFLDGFSPAKNPAMWHPALYAQLARLSAPGATIATFTSAGHVRRGLQDAGFAVRKVAGYAHKREMSVGEFQPTQVAAIHTQSAEALVIGGGIAGIAAAWQLVRSGRKVRLLEREGQMLQGASANPLSAFTPYFTADWSSRGRLYASAFAHTAHLLSHLRSRGHTIAGSQCGSLMLDVPDSPRARQQERHGRLNLPPEVLRAVTAAEASEIAGVALGYGGHFYAQGGWFSMRDFCQALMSEMGDVIAVEYSSPVERIYHEAGQWHAKTVNGNYSSDMLVLACGYQAAKLLPTLALQPVRGQLLSLPAATAPQLSALRTVLHFGEYLLPSVNGTHIVGSSFGNGDDALDIRAQDTEKLLQSMQRIFPQLDVAELTTQAQPWVGLRCATPQRQPLLGPAKDQPEGLYLSLAHGSRGTLSAPLSFAVDAF